MTDFDLQQQLATQRRNQYAQQIPFSAPQGQMVSGHFVAPNALQYLAAGLRSIGGMQGQKMAEDELKTIQADRANAIASALRSYSEQAMGRPADTLPEGQEGPLRPAQAPDLMGAYQSLLNAPTPELRQMGMQGIAQQSARSAEEAKKRQMLDALQRAGSPQAAIAAGIPAEMVKSYYESRNYGRDKVQYKDVGGKLVPVTEYGDVPTGVVSLDKTGNPFSDLIVRDPSTGRLVPNAPLVQAKEGVARAGRPQISVDARNFNTQESEQSKAYGKTLGEMRGTIMQAGYDAPGKLAQLERMEALLGNVGGGAAAPTLAQLSSFAQSFGIKLDPNLGVKEASEALAREMAAAMRQPGTGPMTDKDFDNFLKRVPDLSKTPQGRAQITSTMRAALERDIRAAQFAREYAAQNGGVIDDNFFGALSDFYAKNPVVTPQMPATNARGQAFSDPEKERRYQEWLKQQGAR